MTEAATKIAERLFTLAESSKQDKRRLFYAASYLSTLAAEFQRKGKYQYALAL